MKKTKKHHFSHPDPEKEIVNNRTKKRTEVNISAQDLLTARDLKRVLMSIGIFTSLLVALYFLNLKFDLLQKFTGLINF